VLDAAEKTAQEQLQNTHVLRRALDIDGRVDPQKLYSSVGAELRAGRTTPMADAALLTKQAGLAGLAGDPAINQYQRLGKGLRTVLTIKNTIGQLPQEAATYYMSKHGMAQGLFGAAAESVAPAHTERWVAAFKGFYDLARNVTVASTLADEFVETQQ
jgi:hypothetical protein